MNVSVVGFSNATLHVVIGEYLGLVLVGEVMLVSLLAVSYFVCVHADLKTGSATTATRLQFSPLDGAV